MHFSVPSLFAFSIANPLKYGMLKVHISKKKLTSHTSPFFFYFTATYEVEIINLDMDGVAEDEVIWIKEDFPKRSYIVRRHAWYFVDPVEGVHKGPLSLLVLRYGSNKATLKRIKKSGK